MNIELLSDERDIPELAKIWDIVEHQEYFSEASREWLYGFWEAYGTENAYLRKEGSIYILVDEGRAIGVSGWSPCSSDCLRGMGFMRWHGIVKDQRKLRNSMYLMNFVMSDMRLNGIKTVLELSDSEKARDYFVFLGFKRETNPDIIKGVRMDAGDFKYVLRYDIK